jgi:hypothetical protein
VAAAAAAGNAAAPIAARRRREPQSPSKTASLLYPDGAKLAVATLHLVMEHLLPVAAFPEHAEPRCVFEALQLWCVVQEAKARLGELLEAYKKQQAELLQQQQQENGMAAAAASSSPAAADAFSMDEIGMSGGGSFSGLADTAFPGVTPEVAGALQAVCMSPQVQSIATNLIKAPKTRATYHKMKEIAGASKASGSDTYAQCVKMLKALPDLARSALSVVAIEYQV